MFLLLANGGRPGDRCCIDETCRRRGPLRQRWILSDGEKVSEPSCPGVSSAAGTHDVDGNLSSSKYDSWHHLEVMFLRADSIHVQAALAGSVMIFSRRRLVSWIWVLLTRASSSQ